MNFEFERVFFEAKYSHRIFLNKFTKNFHNFFLCKKGEENLNEIKKIKKGFSSVA